MTPETGALPYAYDDLVVETVQLLNSLRFDAREGCLNESERVTVRVSPDANREPFHVTVTCYLHGHRVLDWNRLRIGLTIEGQPESLTLLPLCNPRGQLRFSGLPPGAYRIVAFQRVPMLYRQTAPTRHAIRRLRRSATRYMTANGQSQASRRAVAIFEQTLPTACPVTCVEQPLPVLEVAGFELGLSPGPGGIRVHAGARPSATPGGGVEFCFATQRLDTPDQAPTPWQRARLDGLATRTDWGALWPEEPAAALELLYRPDT